jgi:hypothetical protein
MIFQPSPTPPTILTVPTFSNSSNDLQRPSTVSNPSNFLSGTILLLWFHYFTTQNLKMGFEQYHEPAHELPEETRTFARMIMSVIEEAEAINWYEQRISVEKDKSARAIMKNAQKEEFKHFGMDLEFLLRQKAEWKQILQGILFKEGDIVEHGEDAEEKAG